jgi:hypothetical protein
MVWRDLDFGVDARGAEAADVWRALLPLLARCSSLHYEADDERYYFVMQLDGWKLDVSVWRAGVPPALEAFHDELAERLRAEPELRLRLLRLKDAWYADPSHEPTVGYEIYRAVLDHDVRSVDELEAYLP